MVDGQFVSTGSKRVFSTALAFEKPGTTTERYSALSNVGIVRVTAFSGTA